MNPRFKACCFLSFLLAFQRTALAQGSLSPPGPPDKTMRSLAEIEPRTPISSLPFAITQPGTYYLTGNLAGSYEGITVSAPNVTIDLNGFELVGDAFVFGHALIVVPSDKVAVQGGVIRNWGGNGVHAPGCSNVVLSALRVSGCAGDGVEVGSATLRDVVSENNTGAGVRAGSGMGAGKAVFQDFHFVRARGNAGGGITYVGPCDASLVDSVVCDNTGSGVSVVPGTTTLTPRLRIERCRLDDNTGDALTLPAVTDVCYSLAVFNSSASRNGGRGLNIVHSSATARGQTAVMAFACTSNGSDGIRVAGACDTTITDSTISDNAGHGVAWASTATGQEGRVRLERCAVDHNTGRGLHIEESALVRVACSTRGSSFRNNGSDGIAVLLTHANAGLQLDLREGVSSNNGGSGMNVQEGCHPANINTVIDFQFAANSVDGSAKLDCGVAPSLFSRVTACGNGGRGLSVSGGTWTLEDCTVTDNGADGVQAVMRTSSSGHITLIKFADCEVARNGGKGVSIAPDAGGGAYKVSMQDMHITKNSVGGLAFVGPCDASVDGARVSENTGHGLSWASSVGGTAGTPSSSFVRFHARRLFAVSNTASGLHISEGGDVDVDCDFTDCTFDRNGAYGATIQVPHADARLDIMMRGGGACDNVVHGLHLAAGRSANQGFFDVALSRNGASGCNKIDAGASPGTMDRVVAQENGLHGLDLTGGTWSLTRCVASDNTNGCGVVYASRHVRSSHVSLLKAFDCDMERNGGDGLYVHTVEDDASYKVSMQDMHFRSNAGSGVLLSCDNALSSVELDALDCSASGNAVCGVKLIAPVAMDKGLRFRLKGGDCDDNAQGGVFVDDAVVVRSGILIGCVLRNNGAAGLRAPGGALRLEGCVASGNAGDGYLITRPPQAGTLYQFSLDCDGCDAVRNGGSGIAVANYGPAHRASVSVSGGQVCDNVASGIDLSSAQGVRGRVHAVHFGDNGLHGLHSAAASLAVCDNQFTGNDASGLHVAAGACVVSDNVCTDNAIGVHLQVPGSTVFRNTFGGMGSGGLPQAHVVDVPASGMPPIPSDIAPFQSAATGTNPLGNQEF